jgi:hypothetical protein
MEIISWEWGNHLAPICFLNNRNQRTNAPQKDVPEGSSSKLDEESKLGGEGMTIHCGICEHKGSLAEAPPFLCFNCCDAIRRLVWISECAQVRAEHCAPVENAERAGARAPKSAILGKH